MNFPIQIVFKLLALAPQMYVSDASGAGIGYVRQKLLAFKENVTVFTDATQSKPIYAIKADRIIDFNAQYHIADTAGVSLGSVRREGVRSLWRASYVISVGESRRSRFTRKARWCACSISRSVRFRSSGCSPAISSIPST